MWMRWAGVGGGTGNGSRQWVWVWDMTLCACDGVGLGGFGLARVLGILGFRGTCGLDFWWFVEWGCWI